VIFKHTAPRTELREAMLYDFAGARGPGMSRMAMLALYMGLGTGEIPQLAERSRGWQFGFCSEDGTFLPASAANATHIGWTFDEEE
jgi:hypothetical protein